MVAIVDPAPPQVNGNRINSPGEPIFEAVEPSGRRLTWASAAEFTWEDLESLTWGDLEQLDEALVHAVASTPPGEARLRALAGLRRAAS
jgi:hypothetical protein